MTFVSFVVLSFLVPKVSLSGRGDWSILSGEDCPVAETEPAGPAFLATPREPRMFPLTRPIRQGLATTALVLPTVLPTLLVGLYAWRINRPGHIRDVEIELGRQLGLQVTLEAVRYPGPAR